MTREHPDSADELLWALLFTDGPLSYEEVTARAERWCSNLDAALKRLVSSGRVARDYEDGRVSYRADSLVVPVGTKSGQEAAVYDRFAAVCVTIHKKLRAESAASEPDAIGGSTYTFEVWPDHPLKREVYESLARFRRSMSDLRARVRVHNAEHAPPAPATTVVVYAGQHIIESGERRPCTDDS